MYNPPVPQPPTNKSNSIDKNIIQESASTPLQPSSPLQEFRTSVSPIPAKRIHTNGGAHTCGGRSISQVPQNQLESRKRNPQMIQTILLTTIQRLMIQITMITIMLICLKGMIHLDLCVNFSLLEHQM